MAEYWVCVRGELTDHDVTGLNARGVATDDLRRISGGFGSAPIQWQTLRTCVRVSATDDSEAIETIAEVLGLEAADLTAYSAEVFR
jgi:hypothetical protein